MSDTYRTNKRRFYRQGTYYGGIVTGIVAIILLPILLLVIASRNHSRVGTTKSVNPVSTAINGSAMITLDDALMTSGMAAGLRRASAKFPGPLQNLPFTNVVVTSKAGHDIDLSADAQVLGLPINVVHIKLAPQIDTTGHLDFKVIQIYGLDLGPVNQLIEDQINAQFVNIGSGELVKGFIYKLTDVHTIDGGLVVTSHIEGSI